MELDLSTKRQLTEYLQQFLTPERRARFDEVLRWRTNWVQVVLVDLYQQHNASAVLRSCDAMGVQKVHVVETYNQFKSSREVALGSEQWLTLKQYNGPGAIHECISSLKSDGIRVAATVLNAESRPIQELPLDRPVAILFGNEREGLPQDVVDAADDLVHFPMFGFVESYNVSVAAALCLHSLTQRVHAMEGPWHLPEEEHSELLLDWARKSIKKIVQVERQFKALRTGNHD